MGEQRLLFDVTPASFGERLLPRIPADRRKELIRVLAEMAGCGLRPAGRRGEEDNDEG